MQEKTPSSFLELTSTQLLEQLNLFDLNNTDHTEFLKIIVVQLENQRQDYKNFFSNFSNFNKDSLQKLGLESSATDELSAEFSQIRTTVKPPSIEALLAAQIKIQNLVESGDYQTLVQQCIKIHGESQDLKRQIDEMNQTHIRVVKNRIQNRDKNL